MLDDLPEHPSNFQLQLQIVAMHGDVKALIEQVKDAKISTASWQIRHENDDKIEHDKLHTRISNMRLVSGGMSIVSVIVGLFTGIKIGK